MKYPHRHRIIATADVKNEHGAVRRIEVIGNWPRNRWWLVRSMVEPDGSIHWRAPPYGRAGMFDDDPSTTSAKVRDAWIAKLKDLAWDDRRRERPMMIVKGSYNPGMNPFAPQPSCRFDADAKLGDPDVVYEFNVKIRGLQSNAPEAAWDREVAVSLRAFTISLRARYPWLEIEGFTGRSGGWLAIKDTAGRMNKRTLEAVQRAVDKAIEAFKKHMVTRYPR